MSKKEEKEYEEYESLRHSKFKQQKLPGWRVLPSMGMSTTIFFCMGIIFAGLGVVIYIFSRDNYEQIERYDKFCENDTLCNFTFTIKKKMKKKVMVYYKLDGFYQNHRRIIQNQKQCNDFIENIDEKSNFYLNMSSDSDKSNPCTLMARSYFNDNYTYFNKTFNGENLALNFSDKNIAREYDRKKYKKWIEKNGEHFIVWMRPSPIINFTKLYGRIDEDLNEGDNITVQIQNNYNVTPFGDEGGKYLVFKSVNNFGGDNTLLAIEYMAFGGICIILGIIFIFGYNARSKKEK